MAPIKIIMCIGIALMLLQAIAMFFRTSPKAPAASGSSHELRADRRPDVLVDDAAAAHRAAGVRRDRLRRVMFGAAAVGRGRIEMPSAPP
jgi:hypothetical protein